MLFLSQPHELDNNAFLVTHNKTYSYNDIFKIGDTIFPNRWKNDVFIQQHMAVFKNVWRDIMLYLTV